MACTVVVLSLISLALCGRVFCVCNNLTAAVTTTSGQVIGCQRALAFQGITIAWKEYLSIPYAAPPTGELRFKKPVPATPWNRTLIATEFGKVCIQFGVSSVPAGYEGEDCLSLNIFAPATNSLSGKKAVMVFVHGGSYVTGSSQPYNGTAIATIGDVVLVTVNYRLGPLGFISTGDNSAAGNMALWDVVEALKWLNKNIDAFGGDPQKVTLLGESAGAMMVSYLMTSPLIDTNLIQRAVLQSGSFLAAVRSNTETVKLTGILANQLSCSADKSDDVIKCLQRVPIQTLKEGVGKVAVRSSFFPVTDGTLLTLNHCSSIVNLTEGRMTATGNMAKFDMMIGHNSQEGLLYIPVLDAYSRVVEGRNVSQGISYVVYDGALDNLLNGLSTGTPGPQLLSAAVRHYYEQGYADLLTNRTTDEKRLKWSTELYGDMTFVWPSIISAILHQQESSGPKAYFYVFDHKRLYLPEFWYEGPDWLRTGADHADELSYVFGLPVLTPMPEVERNLSLSMLTYWTNFAKFGNPTPGMNIWPAFTNAKDYVTITAAGLQKATNPASDLATFWNAIMSSACQLESGPPTCIPTDKTNTGVQSASFSYVFVLLPLTSCFIQLFAELLQ